MTHKAVWVLTGNTLARIWIYGGVVFFFRQFSTLFYQANKPAVDAAITALRDHLPH
jgi:hypothetical protein